jgi:glycosyltransferase involved in cell wall biosynthesis
MDNDFSVLMAVYRRDDPTLLHMALSSVYENSITPTQVVLVQDGPVGVALGKVIASFQQLAGFELVQLDTNVGLACALNEGLKYVSSEFVFRADADDINLKQRFATQLPLLKEGFDLVGSSILEVDQDSRPIATRCPPITAADIRIFVRKRNPFNHMSVAFRRSTVLSAGGYPNIHLKEDYALWAIMIAGGAACQNIDEVLVHANAGIGMYKRRGGLRYVLSELEMQNLLVRLGLQNVWSAIFVGCARSAVFLLPANLRGFIYEHFLRKKA